MQTLENQEIIQVFGKSLTILPNQLTSTDGLSEQFKAMLGSSEAGEVRGVVYCYLSETPIKTKNGETNILYMGKTKSSIRGRYLQYAGKLSTGKNGEFYKRVIKYHGGIKMGFIRSVAPREDERACFARYRKLHAQMPPKSKRG